VPRFGLPIIEVDRRLANPGIAFSQCLRASGFAFCPHFLKCDCSHRANELQTIPCFNIPVKMGLHNGPIGADAAKATPSAPPVRLARRGKIARFRSVTRQELNRRLLRLSQIKPNQAKSRIKKISSTPTPICQGGQCCLITPKYLLLLLLLSLLLPKTSWKNGGGCRLR